jgi:hypothetical protein
MSEHRASLEKGNANADPVEKGGRLASGGKRAKQAPREFAGVGVTACRQRGAALTRETHTAGGQPPTGIPRGIGWAVGAAERLVVAMKPGNAGGVKEPQFKEMTEEGKARRLA